MCNSQKVGQQTGVVRRWWYGLLRAVASACDSPWHEVRIRLDRTHRKTQHSLICLDCIEQKWGSVKVTHHSKQLLVQRFMGEELQWGGRGQRARMPRMRIVKAPAYRQVIPQQLHLIFYPLQWLLIIIIILIKKNFFFIWHMYLVFF